MDENEYYEGPEETQYIYCNFRCTGVFVIQSLTGERATGKELFDDIIKRYSELKGFDSQYREVFNRQEFFELIENIVDAVINKRHYPMLHLEIHGDENKTGLVLASGELVTWEELATFCRRINIHLKNELIISLAVCHGIFLYKAVDFRYPAPFYGILGPKSTAYNSDLLENFILFFDALLTTQDLGIAITPFNLLKKNTNYSFITAELLFEELRNYDLENPTDYSHLNRATRRLLKKDPKHPLSGQLYWELQRKKFLMQ